MTVSDSKLNITVNLLDLEAEPHYRGCIEVMEGDIIEGWCIDAVRPDKVVDVEIRIGSVLVAIIPANIPRPDLSKTLRFPVRAGFRFSIAGITSDRARAAREKLEAHLQNDNLVQSDGDKESEQTDVFELCSVIVAGTPYHLLKLKTQTTSTRDEVEQLSSRLRLIIVESERNWSIDNKQQLLAASYPRDTQEGLARILAFYLPQFQPIIENDEWWGTGFTEWTHVSTARPFFKGHYQPRIPADLGYYDLRLDASHLAQVNLARQYGISGFCYHYYWFNGKKLLEGPIARHARENFELDFCICWANENWSRRWDGSEFEVLLAQKHSLETDATFIDDVIEYFKHPRYVKIAGAPLLIVYRIDLLEDPHTTIRRWKDRVREAGFPNLHICMAETFGLDDPKRYGCDSSVQFPPHGITATERTKDLIELDPIFSGKVYDYREVIAGEIVRPPALHLRFPCVMTGWDNTSRRGAHGHVFHGATPDSFKFWLGSMLATCRANLPPDSQYVFINAWNEWGEGTYLEPDRKYGHLYLEAVRDSLAARGTAISDMLEPLTRGEQLSPIELASVQDNIQRAFLVLQNANEHLLYLTKDLGHRSGFVTSPFIQEPHGLFQRELTIIGAQGFLESINGALSYPSVMTVRRSGGLFLRGWVSIPGFNCTPNTPMFLRVRDRNDQAKRYLASLRVREKRPDVSSALKVPDTEVVGFEFRCDFRSVTPGTYQLSMVIGGSFGEADATTAGVIEIDFKYVLLLE